jgi:phosphogluconate dehydratase
LLHGPIGKVRTGDMILIDADKGVLDVEIDASEWAAREVAQPQRQAANEVGFGRELFGVFRAAAMPAELGASVFGPMVGENLSCSTVEHATVDHATKQAHATHSTGVAVK